MIWYFLIRFWYDSPCSSCLSGCPFRWIQTVISLILTGFIFPTSCCYAEGWGQGREAAGGSKNGTKKKDVLTDQGRTGYYTPAWTSRQEAMDKILLTVDYYEFYWTKPAPIWCTSAWEQLFHTSVQTGMLLPVRFKFLPSDYLTKVWQLWKVTTFTSYYFFGG